MGDQTLALELLYQSCDCAGVQQHNLNRLERQHARVSIHRHEQETKLRANRVRAKASSPSGDMFRARAFAA